MHTIKTPIPIPAGCVYKLFWGEKYIIVKCKTFLRSKTIFEQSLEAYLRRGKRDNHYTSLFKYIKSIPYLNFTTEILFESENPYRLLVEEQIQLDSAKNDENCLNESFDAYVPVLIQGKRKTWINRGHYLNFRIWLKKRRQSIP